MSRISDEEFTQMIMDNKEHLYKCAYYYLGDSEDAVEAVQETACRAYTNRKKFKSDKRALKAWITKILVNYCKDVYKRRSKVMPIDDFQKVKGIEDTYYVEPIVENYTTFNIIKKIRQPYKEVLILRFIRDMKIKDIAKILDKPESTIKSQVQRAVQLFKEEYVQEEECLNAR